MGDFEVYLMAKPEWKHFILGAYVVPGSPFKIGVSFDPVTRLAQLKGGGGINLMLVGVIQGFASFEEAEAVETEILTALRRTMARGRGEWMKGNPMIAWEMQMLPRGGLLLNPMMEIDLPRAPLIPFPPGHLSIARDGAGTSDAFHDYLRKRDERNKAQAAEVFGP